MATNPSELSVMHLPVFSHCAAGPGRCCALIPFSYNKSVPLAKAWRVTFRKINHGYSHIDCNSGRPDGCRHAGPTGRRVAAGVRQVWHIDPSARTACAYTAEDQGVEFGIGGVLSADNLLPGFELSLARLFAKLDSSVSQFDGRS